jgi:hypothetical protein
MESFLSEPSNHPDLPKAAAAPARAPVFDMAGMEIASMEIASMEIVDTDRSIDAKVGDISPLLQTALLRMLLVHGRDVVEPVEVGKRLQIRLMFYVRTAFRSHAGSAMASLIFF